MTIREQIEDRERQTLSPHAARAAESRGRKDPEREHPYRTAYQRDRDRILHTKAFRRLKRKTQVFLAPQGDHYRTRLTHTLEVAQIARTVARALFLNEDLVEAIALGHDLGHTPFGHAGEAVLNEVFAEGFRHFEQSHRVVDKLESRGDGPGLNLTWEVLDGILWHSHGKAILFGKEPAGPATLEGRVLSICDAIAYISHDIDDAVRAGLITIEDLPRDAVATLGRATSARLDRMVSGLIEGSTDGTIRVVPEILDPINALRDYLYREVYPCPAIDGAIRKAKSLLRALYFDLVEKPTPEILAGDTEESLERRTVDFVAGMTDEYALQLYERRMLPSPWVS
ncbi:MAG TPA: deoxyguanosinetriphosphate triphosphohydrolase [Candidatus Hydrogenedentes bacterium]|nr:deoxyguanosinetriphosphate triphosphohydrolase [Candidatus Hydrogenedentota bacterium]